MIAGGGGDTGIRKALPIPTACLLCGHDHDGPGELCPRCQQDTAEEYDRMRH